MNCCLRLSGTYPFVEVRPWPYALSLTAMVEWRRALGFGFLDAGSGLVAGTHYDYRITGHFKRRDIEESVLPYTKAHGIGVLAYGPLGHGLLSGALTPESRFAPDDWRSKSDVFQGEPYRRNLRVVSALERFAQVELGTSVSRLAIAWVLANPAVQVAIVGTRNPRHIDDAIAAADLDLDASALRRIEDIISDEVRVGGPSPESV